MAKPSKKKTVKRPPEKLKRRKPAKAKLTRTPGVLANGAEARGPVLASAVEPDSTVLDRLFAVVLERRKADPAVSHSARLLARGRDKVAQKFGEEAIECLIETVAGNRDAVVTESADVLYHLLVLWVASGVDAEEVWAELKRREGISGIAEKAARARDLPVAFGPQTTKIP